MCLVGHTPQTWQTAGHTYEPYSNVYRQNPYVAVVPPPPRVVAASAPATPKESAALGPDGCFVLNSRADVMLRSWCAPVAAGRGAQYMPLLVVGQSVWPAVTKALRQLHAYPANYDRISAAPPATPRAWCSRCAGLRDGAAALHRLTRVALCST